MDFKRVLFFMFVTRIFLLSFLIFIFRICNVVIFSHYCICIMTRNNTNRQGHVFDDSLNPEISLYFASYDDIDELCDVINWAYRGKPSALCPGELYSGWVGEQHLLVGPRIIPEELRELIDDDEHNIILVAKLKTDSRLIIVGCYKISIQDKDRQVGEKVQNDVTVEFGMQAVDPDYQSRGIGSLLYKGAIVSLISDWIY